LSDLFDLKRENKKAI